nr:unnamed protein product [Digitaria exilis]
MDSSGRVLSSLLVVVVLSMQVLLVPVVTGLRPPAIYVFGDSTLDVGNNNYLPGKDVARANRSYYGIDFPGIPTGRFSNGYNTADCVAKSMGFGSSPPPYLSLLAPTTSSLLVLTALTTGVSYASGDAGILDSTNAGKTISLSRQVHYFKATKEKMVSTLGSHAVDAILSKSIFLIGIGSNDMFVFSAAEQQQQGDVAAFYASLVSNYSAAIHELYKLGARKFAIINVGLVGCVPRVRVLDAAAGACADAMNELAAGFDAALEPMLARLAGKLPGMAYSLADSFGLTQDAFANPEASGYTDIAGACCGGGRLGAEADCQLGATLCADRDRFLFWDRVHPSQRAAMLSAKAFYDGPAQFTSPITFKQLLAHKIF